MPTPGKRALFLGLDGVMHHRNASVSQFLSRMPLLEQTIGAANIDLVVLSCWDFATDFERLKAVFSPSLRGRVIGRTVEETGALHKRFKEIQNWLRTHPAPDWRALDSDPYDYPDTCSEFIRCSPAIGLTTPQAETLKLWLQNPKVR
jgi:hypothetical protein